MKPGPVRVLVVDDSSVVRRLVTDALQTDSRIRVIGVASNGRDGLRRVDELKPDLVTLDMEMPELDGAGTLKEIRRTWPKLPVVMVSSLSRRSVAATLDALGSGPTDYVAKPTSGGAEAFASQLCPRVLNLVRPSGVPSVTPTTAPPSTPTPGSSAAGRAPAAPPPRLRRTSGRLRLVVVAASTGGPDALARFLGSLTRPFPLPIAVVQHMPPVFTTMFAARLGTSSGFDVVEATDGVELRAGRVVLAPGDHHLVLQAKANQLLGQLDRGPAENSCRPAADVLFRTASAAVHGELVAVVLTGLGRDGRDGARAVRDAGGRVLVQDRATSTAWGMPGAVVEAGLADQVLPLHQLAPALTALVMARGQPVTP